VGYARNRRGDDLVTSISVAMCARATGLFRQIAMAAAFLLAAVAGANAMNFSLRDQNTMLASGPIEEGDAAKFATLTRFGTLKLDSPGGFVGEALAMAANMDARGGIRTVVKAGASCASACAMALFASGKTRIVYMGGRLGIHSCRNQDGTPALECNKAMAANAFAHGVPWGVIEGFGNHTKPSSMLWLGAEDAECWGLMKWNAEDTSNNGIDCYKWASRIPADDVNPTTAKDADYVACRANAGTSRTYISTGHDGQGFSDVYREACERIATDHRPSAASVTPWRREHPHGADQVNIADGRREPAIASGQCSAGPGNRIFGEEIAGKGEAEQQKHAAGPYHSDDVREKGHRGKEEPRAHQTTSGKRGSQQTDAER
jgi:hypothetical protein